MTRSPGSTCALGASPEAEALTRVLRLADRLDAPAFRRDDTDRWPRDLLTRFVDHGLLREISPAGAVRCDSCTEGHVLEPELRHYPAFGKTLGVAKCPECGRVEIELERLRRWGWHWGGLADHLTRGLAQRNRAVAVVLDRVWFLGSVLHEGVYRDVFLARGLIRPDAGLVISQAHRLRASRMPAILVPARLPPAELCGPATPAVAALTEIAAWTENGLQVDWSRLLGQPAGHGRTPSVSSSVDGGASPAATVLSLTDAESDILEALAARPHEAMLLVDIMAAAGYGKQATRATLTRLRRLGLVAKPDGTERKGDAITAAGRTHLEQISGAASLPACREH